MAGAGADLGLPGADRADEVDVDRLADAMLPPSQTATAVASEQRPSIRVE